MEGWEKKLEEQNSHLKAELESTCADLKLVNNDLDSIHSELGIICSELASVHADKESTEWIIEIQESQIQRKRHEASQLWKEQDNCLGELEEE
ncbi:hypothetical protein COCNU_02G011100 [Cocos nucifera]|uniref:Uncharacterized protein n=1 Tax=Cocos nucifera TaxID=13894 RepID=A0A8K0I024_COCNU|nr:hypothetical protein COCNU_02G011100 [Cocos nucifera]